VGYVVVLAASVAVIAGGLIGVDRLLSPDAPAAASGSASSSSTPSVSVVTEPLDVSGSGVGAQPFGTRAAEVLAVVTARLGQPDLSSGPQRYFRVPGSDAWHEAADDPLSPSWQYPITSVTCWDALCLLFGGDAADSLRLRGWELAQHGRWSGFEATDDVRSPDVRLAGTGIGLGDSWERLHSAYPGTVAGGAEGASMAVTDTPWTGISDGVAGWRLSGLWDYSHPTRAPAGAVVTRLSGGTGPQPGCC
jgi:hypothetical protein